jgi:integrase
MASIRLTDARVSAAAKGGKRVSIMDAAEPGLELRVAKKGATFALRRSVAGKDVRLTLGRYPAMSLSAARAKALDLKNRLEKEGDFRAQDRKDEAAAAERAAYTVSCLADDWLRDVSKRVRLSTLTLHKTRIDKHIRPVLGARPIGEVKRADVRALLHDIAGKGHAITSNRVGQILAGMYAFAIDELEHDVSNPAANLKRIKERSRERCLSDEELRRFWLALDNPEIAPSPQIAILLKLAALTAQRGGELCGMCEAELDFDERVWCVPGSRTKSGRDNVVPLTPAALRLIRQAIAFRGKREKATISRVFLLHRDSVAQAMRRLCKRIGMAPATPHDLRRTSRTLLTQERCGVQPHIAERCLSHLVGDKVSNTYDRNSYALEKRRALESLGAVIEGIVAGERGPNVVPMARP